ncbi:putative salutaridinol 7-O-acetyltransferase [Lupinus albus]|uniref:Putative salutaridinol 7-O-acetyltransferase n=1 Tax=Lupinus albus TaxID=3870 RepID=A0A6A4Q972_LUPAL|nr:putative salutaridinol 7-O-acetyltransferase [Lupinus albus]
MHQPWYREVLIKYTATFNSRQVITMKIELISREVIKPSKPTPSYLNTHSLSFIDCVVGRNYVPLVYFYPNKYSKYDDKNQERITKISTLKKSLSEVLSIYYPFAGKLRDQLSIECNDQGVLLLVTRIKSKVLDILKNPSEVLLNPLFPDDLPWKVMGSSESIVAIQINCFECGGIAISVCMSHKVGDGSTLFNFVNDWATLTRKPLEEGGLPFPPELDAGNIIIRKWIFSNSTK